MFPVNVRPACGCGGGAGAGPSRQEVRCLCRVAGQIRLVWAMGLIIGCSQALCAQAALRQSAPPPLFAQVVMAAPPSWTVRDVLAAPQDHGLGKFWFDRKTRIAIVNCGAHNKNDFTAPDKAIRTHYLALVAVPASVALVDLVDPALVLADLLLGALASPQGHLHGLLEGLASFF